MKPVGAIKRKRKRKRKVLFGLLCNELKRKIAYNSSNLTIISHLISPTKMRAHNNSSMCVTDISNSTSSYQDNN